MEEKPKDHNNRLDLETLNENQDPRKSRYILTSTRHKKTSLEVSEGSVPGGVEYSVNIGRNKGSRHTLKNITNFQRAVYSVTVL